MFVNQATGCQGCVRDLDDDNDKDFEFNWMRKLRHQPQAQPQPQLKNERFLFHSRALSKQILNGLPAATLPDLMRLKSRRTQKIHTQTRENN